MRNFLVTHINTKESWVVSLNEAAHLVQLKPVEIKFALKEQEFCRTDCYTITHASEEQVNVCFMLEDGDRHVGYFRKRENAARVAGGLIAPRIGCLQPPDPIACEDDERRH